MRATRFALAFLLAAAAAAAETYYTLELHGGARLYALDRPVAKGKLLLFHRYPDGVYMSLAAAEVARVTESREPPPAERLAPGEVVFVGPPLEGRGRPREIPPDEAVVYGDSPGYDYPYYYGGGYFPPLPPPVPPPRPPRVPSNIGPNGYPILAPPGSPGSVPPPIGPNGYPILAPPPAPARRPR